MPALDDVRIATPCTADWNQMIGDARVRHCGQCQLNVYNLSGMSRDEATALLEQHEGRICVRLYQRKDGTVVTQSCASRLAGARRAGVSSFAVALALGGTLLAAACGFGAGQETETTEAPIVIEHETKMGEMMPVAQPEQPQSDDVDEDEPDQDDGVPRERDTHVMMGKIAYVPTSTTGE